MFLYLLPEQMPEKPEQEGLHTVQPGDTLYRLARMYNVHIDIIREKNNLEGDTLSVGDRLRIR